MRKPGELTDRATLRALHEEQFDLSLDTVNGIMAHHHLSPVRTLTRLEGYFTNTIFELAPETGDSLILKIEHRPGWGSLEAELAVNKALKQATDLPGCICFQNPFLLSSATIECYKFKSCQSSPPG